MASTTKLVSLFNADTTVAALTTTTAFVEAAYENLLGLSGAFSNKAERVGYWVGQINTGAVSKTDFAAKFLEAAAVKGSLLTNAEFAANTETLKAIAALDESTLTSLANVKSAVTASTSAATGSTFTLTTATDNISGTSGNDTINGAETSYTDSATPVLSGSFGVLDNINGGAGTDTLNLAVQGGGATYTTGAIAGATISGVEILNVRAIQTQAADIVTLDAATVPGLTHLNSDRSTSVVTVTNLASGAEAGMIGDNAVTNGAFNAGYASTATAAVLNVSGGTKAGNVAVTGTGVTALTVNSTGSIANVIGTVAAPATATSLAIKADVGLTTGAWTAAGATSLTVTGSASTGTAATVAGDIAGAAVRIGAAPGTVATIDASGMTAGGVQVALGTAVTSFKGGAGVDAVTTAALTATGASIIDGGAGTDVLKLNAATDIDSAAKAAKYANFEVLDVGGLTVATNGLTNSSISALMVGGNATLTNVSAAQAAAVTVYANSSANYGVSGASTVGQLDTLKLTVDDQLSATNTITLANITAAGVETIDLVANDAITVSSLTGAAALTSMTITGSKDVSVTTGALALNVNTVVNAANSTGAVTVDATNATTNGISITGTASTKVNTLTGSAQADTIIGGAGNDVLKGLAGNDTITGGAGNDTITGGTGVDTIDVGEGIDIIDFTATAAETLEGVLATGANLANADKVTGMGNGDKIDLDTVANLVLADGAITVGTTFATATANLVTIVSGSYDTTTKLFTSGVASATNNDYVVQWNGGTSTTTVNSMLLIDIVGTLTATSASEIITLSVA